MFAADNPHIPQLLSAAGRDEHTLQFDLPSEIFGFHVQQAVEKLYKVLVTANGEEFDFTHDLVKLGKQLVEIGERLPAMTMTEQQLTDYAVQRRYEDGPELVPVVREALRRDVVILREFVERRQAELEAAGTLVKNP
jgi:HEPN domain-containing protein